LLPGQYFVDGGTPALLQMLSDIRGGLVPWNSVVLYPGTYTLADELVLNSTVTLSAKDGPGTVVLEGGGTTRLITVEHDPLNVHEVVTLVDLHLVNGRAASGGAVSVTGGALVMSGCTVSDNAASGDGGAFHVSGGSLQLEGCTVTANNATGAGGAVYVAGGQVDVTRSELAGNLAGGVTGADVHVGGAFPSQARLAFDGVRTGQLFLGANLDPAASALANLTFEWPAGEIPVTSQASATPPRP